MRERKLSGILLRWYDRSARDLPWRVAAERRRSGQMPDPYSVWLSEIMLQQTSVATVSRYFSKFMQTWPTVNELANAEYGDVMAAWAGLGYYARARNLLKCARTVVEKHAGQFPSDVSALRALPGIGPYTAAAIAAIAFDKPEVVVDGNVERVMARMHAVEARLPAAKVLLHDLAAELTPTLRPGDYAQAVMDLGATVCRPAKPDCPACPWHDDCLARASGRQGSLPNRLPRTPKPTRCGIAYIGRRADGALLLERRPENALLGGMLGWPGSGWSEQERGHEPCPAAWRLVQGEVKHAFTHFHLRMRVKTALLPDDIMLDAGEFVARPEFDPSSLPTVMRKAYNLALADPTFQT